MANITARLLKIGSTDITKICDYTVEYGKLWKDAERNMNGSVRASLIGVFPKIKVKTTVQEISNVITLGNLLNQDFFQITYFDILDNAVRTANYYASDFSTTLRRRKDSLINEIEFSLVPVDRKV